MKFDVEVRIEMYSHVEVDADNEEAVRQIVDSLWPEVDLGYPPDEVDTSCFDGAADLIIVAVEEIEPESDATQADHSPERRDQPPFKQKAD